MTEADLPEPALHPNCEQLAFLLGTWRGEGKGFYPTITGFVYEEESRFWHVGKPFLSYSQRTWDPVSGAPLHSEMGYWRCTDGGAIEVVLAHPFGYAEVGAGSAGDGAVTVSSAALVPTPTAKTIESVTRTVSVSGDTMRYEVAMAAQGERLQGHLEAVLTRV